MLDLCRSYTAPFDLVPSTTELRFKSNFIGRLPEYAILQIVPRIVAVIATLPKQFACSLIVLANPAMPKRWAFRVEFLEEYYV
jgi:hypothetical protein